MSTLEFIKSLNRQCEHVNKLIEEADASLDEKQSLLLYGMARDESDNVSNSLRTYLARKLPGHRLTAA